jgi:hypothetical protein
MTLSAFGVQASFSRRGVFVYWRLCDGTFTRGFVIKRKSDKLFSERYGDAKGRDIGPLYVRAVEKDSP